MVDYKSKEDLNDMDSRPINLTCFTELTQISHRSKVKHKNEQELHSLLFVAMTLGKQYDQSERCAEWTVFG